MPFVSSVSFAQPSSFVVGQIVRVEAVGYEVLCKSQRLRHFERPAIGEIRCINATIDETQNAFVACRVTLDPYWQL